MTATVEERNARISAAILREQREELERIAREQDRTISYLVRQAVDRYLADDLGIAHAPPPVEPGDLLATVGALYRVRQCAGTRPDGSRKPQSL